MSQAIWYVANFWQGTQASVPLVHLLTARGIPQTIKDAGWLRSIPQPQQVYLSHSIHAGRTCSMGPRILPLEPFCLLQGQLADALHGEPPPSSWMICDLCVKFFPTPCCDRPSPTPHTPSFQSLLNILSSTKVDCLSDNSSPP